MKIFSVMHFTHKIHCLLLEKKKKHLNRRTDTPLWLVIHSNALAEYSLKFEQVKST